MAYRELHVIEVKEILRLWTRGHGLRTIANRTSTDRKTVRRYVEAGVAAGLVRDPEAELGDQLIGCVVDAIRPGAPPSAGLMREHLRTHQDAVRGWLNEGCRGPKLVRLLHRKTGVAVPLRTMQRFVRQDLGVKGASASDTMRLVDPDPGVLEIDFLVLGDFEEIGTGRKRKLHGLLCTAGHSRHQFLWPCLSQTLTDVIEGLEAAWEFFGGVFPILLPDNLKAIVKVPDPVHPVFNETFIEYAQARKFEIDPARVKKPKDKPRVERQVRFVRDDYFKGERFRSVQEARLAAVRWSRVDAGMRIHGRTRRRPLEAFEETEKTLLSAAPTEPYDQPRWGNYHMGRDHAVVVNHALYSLPYDLDECDLRVRVDRTTVKFYLRGRLVKMHPRQPEGGTSLDPADAPPGKAALMTRNVEVLYQEADRFGPHVGEYARRLAVGPFMWSQIRHVYRLLGLARRYGNTATDEACARALEVDVVEVKRIKGMLEKGLVRRGLLTSVPSPAAPSGKVLRFERPRDEFRTTGGSDATA